MDQTIRACCEKIKSRLQIALQTTYQLTHITYKLWVKRKKA